MSLLPKGIFKINAISRKIPISFFKEMLKKNAKIPLEL